MVVSVLGREYVGDITVVVCECVLCQGGYGHRVNHRWDHNRSAAVILVLAASDGDFTAVVGVNEPVADLIPIVSERRAREGCGAEDQCNGREEQCLHVAKCASAPDHCCDPCRKLR